jgi:hypothetical protein
MVAMGQHLLSLDFLSPMLAEAVVVDSKTQHYPLGRAAQVEAEMALLALLLEEAVGLLIPEGEVVVEVK